MNGNAPKSSATGSQLVPTRNLQPNLACEGAELRQSSDISNTVTRKTEAAKINVMRCATSSPVAKRRQKLRLRVVALAAAVADILFNQSDLLRFLVDYRFGKRRIEIGRAHV